MPRLRLTTITALVVGLFLAALLALLPGGWYAAHLVRDRSVDRLAEEGARRNADLTFRTMYLVMSKGWSREEMERVVATIRHSVPDMGLDIVRSDAVAAQYGETEAGRRLRTDPAVVAAFRDGTVQVARQGDAMRYLFPVAVKEECIVCHYTARVGDLNGVIDIRLPVNRLRAPLDLTIQSTLWVFGAVMLALMGVIFLVLRVLVVRPVATLSRHIEALMASGDLTRPLEVPPYCPLEVKQLTRNFNRLVNDLEESRERLTALSITDPLTGLSNRRHFDEELARELDRCRRYGKSMGLLVLDLDRFKAVNDLHGHDAGDAVLRHVAEVLAAHVRRNDLIARFGGDEFAILAPETDAESADALAAKLRAMVAESEMEWRGQRLEVGVSVGAAAYPLDGGTAEGLFKAADDRMYEDKRTRRPGYPERPA